jgi:hypothetical protein
MCVAVVVMIVTRSHSLRYDVSTNVYFGAIHTSVPEVVGVDLSKNMTAWQSQLPANIRLLQLFSIAENTNMLALLRIGQQGSYAPTLARIDVSGSTAEIVEIGYRETVELVAWLSTSSIVLLLIVEFSRVFSCCCCFICPTFDCHWHTHKHTQAQTHTHTHTQQLEHAQPVSKRLRLAHGCN